MQIRKLLKLSCFLFWTSLGQSSRPRETYHQIVLIKKVTGKIQNLTWNGGQEKRSKKTRSQNNAFEFVEFFFVLDVLEVWEYLVQKHHTWSFDATQLFFLNMSWIFFVAQFPERRGYPKIHAKFRQLVIDIQISTSVCRWDCSYCWLATGNGSDLTQKVLLSNSKGITDIFQKATMLQLNFPTTNL